ncbi:class A beta-lactamase-related serine hydrolase [Paenibacillus psychroresistens]|uniref:Class A beta-lactamase-related serine hydrolase n=1 Tax=Paenibacillus psychroresistens TaxID=1778678 RepID=A0A6B8RSK8_9BACL|nr:serine hydrolase domain-containing protein [Paenibacillus psychroresistens]QGQ98897.1 class A beta-lactamase-related serine hydrolase [Paenibacillus psychroresistens]
MNTNINNKVEEYMDAYAACGYFNGSVLVAYKGSILLSKGYGLANIECHTPNSPQTKFRIASLTKAFTSMAIMQLEEKGFLQVSDPLSKYIPDYPLGEQITLHHLLTHSSGITNYTSFPHFDHKIRPFIWTLENLIDEFKHYPLEFNPGESQAYCNSGYILLSFIIEQISGQTYSDYLRDYIFRPLGMKDSGVDLGRKIVLNRADGYNLDKEFIHTVVNNMSSMVGAGGVYTTVEDLYLWDRALYTDALVNKETLQRIFTPYFASYGGYGWDVSHFDIHDQPKKRMAHYGDVEGFVSYFTRYVEDDLTVIVLSNTMIAPVQEINNTLAKIVFGYEISAPIIPAFIEDPNKHEYAREYAREGAESEKINLTFEEDNLYLSSNGTDRYPVNPVHRHDHAIDYIAEYMNERLTFLLNDCNKVTQVIYTNANGDANLYGRSV